MFFSCPVMTSGTIRTGMPQLASNKSQPFTNTKWHHMQSMVSFVNRQCLWFLALNLLWFVSPPSKAMFSLLYKFYNLSVCMCSNFCSDFHFCSKSSPAYKYQAVASIISECSNWHQTLVRLVSHHYFPITQTYKSWVNAKLWSDCPFSMIPFRLFKI